MDATQDTTHTQTRDGEQNVEVAEDEYVLAPDKIPSWNQTLITLKMYKRFPQLKLINRLPQYQSLLKEEDLIQKFLPNNCFNEIVCLWRGDLLRLQLDAIVNSAHHHMGGGGGIDGKIQWKAGEELVSLLKGKVCRVGESLVTPVTSRDPDMRVVESCYRSALSKAVEYNIRTVGFCCIGTGHYENPPVQAAHTALSTIREWLEIDENYTKVDKIIFSVFSARDECIYEEIMPCYFPDPS